MRHDPAVWRLALEALETGVPAALLYVVESLGSSPGRAGFALCLTADAAAGSIGGGAMEHRFTASVRASLAEGRCAPSLVRQIHDSEAETDRSGMICSGEQTFVVLPLASGDALAVQAVLEAVSQRKPGVLSLSLRGLAFDPSAQLKGRDSFVPGPDWIYSEDLAQADKLHIVGGGHCALALSQLAAGLDFDITVYDDRPGLPTWEANSWAHSKVLVPDYTAVGGLIPPGDHQYIFAS